jgi:hypothetical protein
MLLGVRIFIGIDPAFLGIRFSGEFGRRAVQTRVWTNPFTLVDIVAILQLAAEHGTEAGLTINYRYSLIFY